MVNKYLKEDNKAVWRCKTWYNGASQTLTKIVWGIFSTKQLWHLLAERSFRWLIPDRRLLNYWMWRVDSYCEWFSFKTEFSHSFCFKILGHLNWRISWELEVCCYKTSAFFQPPAFVNVDFRDKLWQQMNTKLSWMPRQISDSNCCPLYQMWISIVHQNTLISHT
jgi:hypothetical protein